MQDAERRKELQKESKNENWWDDVYSKNTPNYG